MKLSIPEEKIDKFVLFIRNRHVILDVDLAVLYGIPAIIIKRAVKRNSNSFPPDYMFSLNKSEVDNLSRSNSTSGNGIMKYAPLAFTPEGVDMLSHILSVERNSSE